MSSQVQFRRGTTTQNNAFTGAQGEITYDTDIKTLRLHDGSTAGGGGTVVTLAATQSLTNKTLSTGSVWSGNAIGLLYGGTGSSLTAAAGAVAYSTSGGLALNSAGTSGQLLQSAGSGTPIWVNASSLTTGTATNATTATNIAGGSAGQIVIQLDTNQTSFVTAGAAGTFLKSTGASTAPVFAAGQITIGTTTVPFGDTSNSLNGVVSITMGNGSYGSASVASVSGTGPWTATITGISSTAGILVGQNITATAGTGTLFGGTPTSVLVASVVSGTSITVTVTGGTIPTVGTITAITIFGFLQVPTGTTAQRPYTSANGMIRYNTTQSTFEGYSSAAWSSLGGVKAVNGFTYILAETAAGAANGDLDFYAQNAGVTAAVQIGQWNRTNLKDYTGTLVGTQTTQNVFNATATTVNAFGAATTVSIGAATGTLTINNANTVITGNLTVNGTTTTVNSTTLTVDDINIELGSIASPTDTTANGGGITLLGTTNKTIIYDNTNNNWTSSENWNIATGKVFKINNVSMLSATALGTTVVGSSLTSVGTIGTGVWQGTIVGPTYGGTGVNNGANTLTLAGSVTHAGSFSQLFTATAATNVTLPTSGTLYGTASGSITSSQLATSMSDETGSGALVFGTAPTISLPAIDNIKLGYTTTATAAGTTTLTSSSNRQQLFTGTSTQTVVLPVTSTLTTGMCYEIENNSTGNLTINSSGGNLVATVIPSVTAHILCIGTTLTTAADFDADFIAFSTLTGTGANVLATSPTLVSPALGTPTSGTLTNCTFPTLNQNTTGSAATFTSTTQNSQFNSIGVGTAGSGTAGEIRATNQITAYYSDDRLKTRTGNIQNALEKVLSLDGFHYHANETAVALGYDASKEEVGVSAQQVQAILPEVVVPAPIDAQYLTVHYDRLVPLLVEAIKEQQKQIEELKAKLGN
jgi:hypothetical protein